MEGSGKEHGSREVRRQRYERDMGKEQVTIEWTNEVNSKVVHVEGRLEVKCTKGTMEKGGRGSGYERNYSS
jgi:hypothetical protein